MDAIPSDATAGLSPSGGFRRSVEVSVLLSDGDVDFIGLIVAGGFVVVQ